MRKEERVPVKEVVYRVQFVGTVCDICKDEDEEEFVNEFSLQLNPDDCVGLKVRRDVCNECFEDLDKYLKPMLELLGVPHDHGIYDSDDGT